MGMQGLRGQGVPAVSDIDQYYKENMDKTEAYKVPGAEGRSWLWGFLPECQQSVNSLSNVTKIQLQDVIRRAEVGLIQGQPLEQKETVHTINTRKNNRKEHTFTVTSKQQGSTLTSSMTTHDKSRIPSVPYGNGTRNPLPSHTTAHAVQYTLFWDQTGIRSQVVLCVHQGHKSMSCSFRTLRAKLS